MANKIRISDADWIKIKFKYESSNPDESSLVSLAKEFNCSKSLIALKAKTDNWKRANNRELKVKAIKNINEMIEISRETSQHFSKEELVLFEFEVIEESQLKLNSKDIQHRALNLMRKAIKAADKFIDSHTDGKYVKSETDKGVTYGLVTEMIPHISQGLSNTLIKEEQNLIQINNNQQNNTAIDSNMTAQEASRAYTDLMDNKYAVRR